MEHRIGARVALAITVSLVACSTHEERASFSEDAASRTASLASSGDVGASSGDPGARESADDGTAPPFAPFPSASVVPHLGELELRLPFPELPARAGPPPSIGLAYGATPVDAVRGFGIGFQLDVPALEMAGEGGVPLRSLVAATGDLTVRLQHGTTRLLWVAREQVEGCDRIEYRPDFGDERVRFFRFPNGGKRSDGTACFEGFRVAYPDGRQEVYGGSPSIAEGASLPRSGFFPTRWPLEATISPTGETVSYAYTKAEDGRTYLDSVTFAGGRSRYELARTSRPNTNVSYAAGHPLGARQLYTKLTARFDGDVMHQWCFVYDGGSAGGSRVVTHPDCQELANGDFANGDFANGEARASLRRREALVGLYRLGRSPAPFTRTTLREPLVRFRYTELRGADLANHQLVYAYPVPDVYGFGPAGGSELFDLDADGALDVLRFAPADGVSYPSYGQADLAAPQAFVRGSAITLEKIVGGVPQARVLRFDETPQSTSVLLRGDFDGDGRRDLLEASRDGSESQLFLFRGQPGDEPFASPTSSTRVPLDLVHLTMGRAQVVDLNGDGKDDLVVVVPGANEPTWTALVNVTAQGEDEATFVSLSELPLPFRAPRETTLQDASFRFLDANGDGLTDFAVLKVSGAGDKGLCVYENQGAVSAFAPVRTAKVAKGGLVFGAPDGADAVCERGSFLPIPGLTSTQNLNAIWLADVDRDGVADLVDVAPSADALEVWLGLGREGFAPPRTLPLGTSIAVDPRNKWNTRVLDVDGDGAEEILVYEPGAAGGQIKILDFNRHGLRNAVAPGLLLEVAAGAGHEQSFQYATSTDERVRDLRAAGPPVTAPGLPFPVTVVKRLSEVVSGGPARVRELAYHAPVLDARTRSFVGFREVTSVEHGDETQESLGTTWAFGPASPGAPADRYLADRVRHEEVFRPRLSQAQARRIRESASAWPRDLDDASWTDRTWSEEPYVAASTFLKVDRLWKLVPVAGVPASPDGAPTFVRLTEERTATCSSDEACATPSLATSQTEHDDVWNRETREVRSLSRVEGPNGTELPARSHERRLTYDAAWETRGVGTALSREETRVASTGRLLGARSVDYAADRPLPVRVAETVLVDESALAPLPPEARSLVPGRTVRAQVLAYDAFGNVVSTSDDLGEISRTTYDATGVLPVSTANALGHTTTFCYGAAGCSIATSTAGLPAHALDPTAVRGPRGDVTIFDRDDLHRPLRMLSSTGRETTYAYREAGAREPAFVRVAARRLTDAEAATRDVEPFVARVVAFDAAGARLGTARADEHGGARFVGVVAYGRRGNVAFEAVPYASTASPDAIFASGAFPVPGLSCAAGSFACSVHDALGRVTMRTDAPGRWRTKLAYEPWGRCTEDGPTASPAGAAPRVRLDVRRTADETYAVVDEAGHVHRFERDDLGRVLRTWVAGETAPRLTVFDSTGDLAVVHAPGGLTRIFARDGRGRVREERTWDRDFAAHESITRTFDVLDRASTVTTSTSAREGVWDERTFTYDAVAGDDGTNVGLLVAATTRDHVAGASTTERFSYDASADMTARSLTYDAGGTHRAYEERWTYALDGTVVAHVDAVGDAFELTPTPSGAPSRVLWKAADAAPAELLAGITYDARGRLATYAVTPTGARRVLEHEASTGWLTSARVCVARGEGTCTAATSLASHDVTYTRHPDGRLASMRTHAEGDPTTSYAYGPRGELVAARGETAMAYDYAPRGALKALDEGAPRTFASEATTLPALPEGLAASLDGFGRLRAVGAVQGITYDPFGRVRRVEASGRALEYDYTAFGARVAKRARSGAGEGSVVVYPSEATRDDGAERQALVALGGRKVAVVVDGRRVLALVDDQRGVPVAAVDASGRVVASVDYSPYGKLLHAERGEALASTELVFSFTGQSADPDTGFVHMGAREYAPELASFTSPDPFALVEPELCVASPLECHLYGYAQDDPLNVVDPDGLSGVQGPGGGTPKPRPPQRRPTAHEHRSAGQHPSKHGAGRGAQQRPQTRSSSPRQAGGAIRGVPRGMGSMKAFEKFSATLREGLEAAGFKGVEPVFQGSAVTGFSYAKGHAFDQGKEGLSDWDVALCGAGILGQAKKVGLEIRSDPTRTQPLGLDKPTDMRAVEAMGLRPLAEALKQQYGRSVNFMIYENVETAVSRSPSILFPR